MVRSWTTVGVPSRRKHRTCWARSAVWIRADSGQRSCDGRLARSTGRLTRTFGLRTSNVRTTAAPSRRFFGSNGLTAASPDAGPGRASHDVHAAEVPHEVAHDVGVGGHVHHGHHPGGRG